MNLKSFNRLEQASGILMNYLAIFCLQTAVFAALDRMLRTAGGTASDPGVMRQALLVLLPFALWAVREKAAHLLSFVGIHLALLMLFPALLGKTDLQRGVFALFAAVYVAQSFFLRFRKEEETPVREDSSVRRKSFEEMEGDGNLIGGNAAFGERQERMGKEKQTFRGGRASSGFGASPTLPPASEPNMLLSAPAAIASFLLCAGLEEGGGCQRIWYASLLFVLLFFFNIYLRNVERFICFNQAGNARIPVRQMLRQGGGMTAGFGVITVLLLGISTNGSLLLSLTEKLKAAGLWLLRGLFLLLSFLFGLSKEGEEAPAERLPSERQVFEAVEAVEQPLWAEILEKVVSFFVLALLCALIFWGLYRLVLFAVSRFHAKRRSEEGKAEETEEIREKLERGRRGKKRERSLPFFAGTPAERIRKSFVRSIRHTECFRSPGGETGRKRNQESRSREEWERIARGLTARQLGDVTGLAEGQSREAFSELTELYEKARYGKDCTKEEAKRAEQAAAMLRRF